MVLKRWNSDRETFPVEKRDPVGTRRHSTVRLDSNNPRNRDTGRVIYSKCPGNECKRNAFDGTLWIHRYTRRCSQSRNESRSAFPSFIHSWSGTWKWMDASDSLGWPTKTSERVSSLIENYSRRPESHRPRLYQLPRVKNLPGGELHPTFPLSGLSSLRRRIDPREIDVDALSDSPWGKRGAVIWFGWQDNFMKRCLTFSWYCSLRSWFNFCQYLCRVSCNWRNWAR